MRRGTVVIVAGLCAFAGCSSGGESESAASTSPATSIRQVEPSTATVMFKAEMPETSRLADYMPFNISPQEFGSAVLDYCHDMSVTDSATALDNLLGTAASIIETGGTESAGSAFIIEGERTDMKAAAESVCSDIGY